MHVARGVKIAWVNTDKVTCNLLQAALPQKACESCSQEGDGALPREGSEPPLPFCQQDLVLHEHSWKALLAGVTANTQQL